MTTPSACRALSARIQAGDKTVTNAEIALAFGWRKPARVWLHNGQASMCPPSYLDRVDATRAEWPDGWVAVMILLADGTCAIGAYNDNGDNISNIEAPTEPAARAALLLEIRAVELEAKENNNG